MALGGAHDRVRLRPPAKATGATPEDDGAAPADAHDRRAGREQRRLQHLARGSDARRLHAVRLRDEAQELRIADEHSAEVRAWRLRRQQGGSPAGNGPEPQLRRPLGRRRREHDLVRRHLSRRRALLGARDPEHPRPDLLAAGHEPDHEPHLLEPRAAPAGRGRLRLPARGAALQGAGRFAGRSQRLLEHPGLRPLRHHRRDRGLVVLVDRRARVHVRDRRERVPPAVRGRRRGRVPRPGRPSPAPARAATARRTTRCSQATADSVAPLSDRGLRAGRLDARDLEDLPDLDVACLGGRLRQRDRRPAPVHRHADVRAEGAGRLVHLEREPVDAADRGRPPRPRPDRAAAGPDHAAEPARAYRRRTRSTRRAGRSRRSRSPSGARPTAWTTAG